MYVIFCGHENINILRKEKENLMSCEELFVTEFDMNTTKGKSQIVKVIIPFLAPTEQRMIAILVRLWELIMTIHYYEIPATCPVTPFSLSNINPELLEEVKKYCTKENQQMIDMILKFMNMQDVMKFMNVFEDMNISEDFMSKLFSGCQSANSNVSQGDCNSKCNNTENKSDNTSGIFGKSSPDLSFILSSFDKSGLYKEFLDELDKKIN